MKKPSEKDVAKALKHLLQQGRIRVDSSGRYTLVEQPPQVDWTVN